MNIESNSNSKNHSPCKVVSKYFQNSPVMDESLSEFKEKKGSCKGPKNSQKSTEQQPKKTKQKKPPKRIKGQKDIRTVLKSKKNDQLTYAKEFDEVCKQAGVDIDSEQLQLAIALSKSLQSSEDNKSSTSQKPLSSQERTKKIRTTLQEYGFAVPEIKITNKRRLKRPRKQYKLLLSSDTEKQQIISDRYSQVLFTSSLSNKAHNENIDYSIIKCYYVATGISYETLQNNNILYVEDLVEKSTSKGRLLRDWADIPGRPKSPVKQESTNMNFSEIECSQDELDIVLSGTLKSAKDIVKKKVNTLSNNTPTIFIDVDTDINHSNNDRTLVTKESNNTDTIDCKNGSSLISNRVRSYSPDIFDDEVSVILGDSHDTTSKESEKSIKQDDTIMDLTGDEQDTENAVKINDCQLMHEKKQNTSVVDLTQTDLNNHTESEQYLFTKKPSNPEKPTQGSQNYTRRNSDDLMEITECVGISEKVNPSPAKEKSTASQNSNDEVKRSSDEFMEVIACVAKTCSQASSNENPHITSQVTDKTKRKSNDFMEITECVASTSYSIPKNLETDIDLTQQSDENDTTVINGTAKNTVENVDLSQSSNEDELPIVEMSQSNKSLDGTILLNNDEIDIIKPKIANTTDSKPIELEETLDLSDTSSPVKSDNYLRPSNNSFFDEFVHNHSDDASTKETLEKSCEIESQIHSLGEENNDNEGVDLTQSSNSSLASREPVSENNTSIQSSKSVEKIQDVSIDYDEMFDAISKNETDTSKQDLSQNSVASQITDEKDGNVSETYSRSSQVFDISDKELEYSMNKSRYEGAWGVDFGGISVIDNDLSLHKPGNIEKQNNEPINRSTNDSFLPAVDIKSSMIKPKKECILKTPNMLPKNKVTTPLKAFTNDYAFTVDTPTSSEYILKTDQVTPMLDFAAMSTPERNRELDKYGLKPFKRKRAIQLLTHLYNQTHPVVESCQEELPSPSKRRKTSQESPKNHKSPRKSPRKLLKSPTIRSQLIENLNNCSKDSNVYEVTNEFPEIKAILCPEEDWVFQKREKAKVHSCRVPLHISLHNYVSCRRKLYEAILRYEPVNIDVIHKELVASGHRYDPKDLLRYLDKKCITVKTADNNARNKR